MMQAAYAAPQAAPAYAPPAPAARVAEIGRVDDPLEREADRIASAIVSGEALPATQGRSAPGVARMKCAECEAEEQDEGTIHRKCAACEAEDKIRMKPADNIRMKPAAAATEAVRRGGQPLSAGERAYFEPRFGRDLSGVRIHAGADAAEAARGIGARAYTLGADIAFAAGEHRPTTRQGATLMAHELAHVVQNEGAATIRRKGGDGAPDPEIVSDQPKTLDQARMEHVVKRPPTSEPGCPTPPTNLGNRTPSPDCNTDGEDLPEGSLFNFCADSDVFVSAVELRNLHELVAKQPSGSEFQVRTYSSEEGPGTAAEREQYNRNLSCHRLNRVIRELLNAGVQETDIDGAALGPTHKFGDVPSLQGMNRAAVVHPIPQARQRQSNVPGMTAQEIANAGKKRLVSQDYKLAADAYFARWTCGRYRTLADAVARTTVMVASKGDKVGPSADLGTTGLTGLNTIILDRDELPRMTDPIECAANRIADLTFHHFVRPVLIGFSDLHAGGMHLIHLAGIGACVNGVPGGTPARVSEPNPKDPFENMQPDCADEPLIGALKPQKGPAKPDKPAIFISSTPALSDPSGKLVMTPTGPGGAVGVDPENPFHLTATVDASGDPATVAGHEIGFIQTVLAEDWVNTYVDGKREVRRLPLPLRDGAPRFDEVNGRRRPNPLSDPPWFDTNSKVKAKPGLNTVSLTDGPNFRAFRFFPDLQRSTFVQRMGVPRKGGGPDFTVERPHFEPEVSTPALEPLDPAKPPLTADEKKDRQRQRDQRIAEANDVPDKGFRRIHFMTWVVARRIGAPATHGDTEFLEGVKLDYSLDVDWSGASPGTIAGRGTYATTATRAAPADSASMLLRGATPQDFVAASGEALFAEFLQSEGALPRAQAQGLSQSQFSAEVQAIVARQPALKGLAPPFVVKVRIDVGTGHVVLDTPDLAFGSVSVERSSFGGHDIDPTSAKALAKAIHPEIRQLTLSGPFSGAQPQSPTISFPVNISGP